MGKSEFENEFIVMDDRGMNIKNPVELDEGFEKETEIIVEKAMRKFGFYTDTNDIDK